MSREAGWYQNIDENADKSDPDNWDITLYYDGLWGDPELHITDNEFRKGRYIHPITVNPVPADEWTPVSEPPELGIPVVLYMEHDNHSWEYVVAVRVDEPDCNWRIQGSELNWCWNPRQWKYVTPLTKVEARVVEESGK